MNTKITKVENKIPDTNGLVTTTALHTKIGEVENKIHVLVVQARKQIIKLKYQTLRKYFTASD